LKYATNASSPDNDSDGILDDGDGSGTIGDNLCSGGNTANCDDNCINTPNADQADSDSNGIGDVCDGCPNLPVRILGAGNYNSLQAAYDKSLDGNTIQSRETTLTGDLNINRDIAVTMQGGYNCDYTVVTGKTSIKGKIVISKGRLNGENYILKK
jgi:hypothetical protein